MDIAAYISDLLKQYGELTIPGLGRFARMRVNGYYNEEEEIMYPPSYRLSFDPDFKTNDDTIANRISFVKNISLTSSQYFLDKFVTGIKEDVAKGDVAFADLGYFHQGQNEKINFTFNNIELTRDEGFFGFAPLRIRKLVKAAPVFEAAPPVAEPAPVRFEPVSTYNAPEYNFEPVASQTEEPAAEEPIPVPAAKEKKPLSFNDIFARKKQEQKPEPVEEPVGLNENLTPETEVLQNEPAETDEFIAEEKEAKSAVKVWMILVAVVVLAAAGMFGLYKYDPTIFDRLSQLQSKHSAGVTKPAADTTAKAYTAKPDTAKINPDTTAQSNAATVVKTDTLATNTKATPTPAKGTETKTDTTAKATVKTKPEPVAVTKRTTVPAETAPTNKPVAKPAAPVTEPAPATTATTGNLDANGNEMMPGITPHHYEVYGVSTHDIKEAERALRNYKSLGFPGRLIQNHNKTHFRVSLGTYNTYKEAREAYKKMIATKKVSEIDLSVEAYTYKIK